MSRRMLLAFDLDKTVVTEDYRLPLRIEQAIRATREAGHLVTVLTGRPRAAALPYLQQLDITGPYSVNHGALVVGSRGEILQQRRIAAADVRALLSPYSGRAELAYSCILDDVLFVDDPDDERWAWAHTLNRTVRRLEPGAVLEADKIVFSANGSTAAIEREIVARHPGFVTYLWDDGFLEITGADADKGGALRLICETLQIAREDTIAFGDGLNDVTMIGWAGYGVAVGPHAHPGVLSAATEHIASPEEEGVAIWLERFLDAPPGWATAAAPASGRR